jgi:hypothetical protein
VRNGFVKKWVAMEHGMLCWRIVNVAAAKAKIAKLDIDAPYKDKDELLSMLKLEKVKEEQPSKAEMGPIDQWASDYVEKDARNIIMTSNKAFDAIHADKFDEALDDDPVLGPLCTKEGVHCKWVTEEDFTRLLCFKNDKRYKPPKGKRPVLVCMHDEVIVRHKDIGRYGWTHRRLASQACVILPPSFIFVFLPSSPFFLFISISTALMLYRHALPLSHCYLLSLLRCTKTTAVAACCRIISRACLGTCS